ncbi:MAG: aminotransferase class V-fold PLP-dependent enzyme, partial [Gammaproteobacteria bacterium]|nr:aminotransferase class V-fold PLP-dependent enzyme [Gammaproteobacteria bacterium]
IVDVTVLRDRLKAPDARVSVMLANNETGVVQPVAQIFEIAAEAGAAVHTDAVQAAGRIALDVPALGVDMASLSAHKLGGPQGVGALILGTDAPIAAQMRGGGQERGRRAGTENTAGIVGFGVAARLAREGLTAMASVAELRDALEAKLAQAMAEVVIFGDRVPRLPNTSCFAVPGLRSETQIMALDLAGLAVSAGSACSSGKVTPSHVLSAMGVPEALAECALRVSLGPENTLAEIDRLIAALAELRGRSARRPADAA